MVKAYSYLETRCFRVYGPDGQKGLAYGTAVGFIRKVTGSLEDEVVRGKFIDKLPPGWTSVEIAPVDKDKDNTKDAGEESEPESVEDVSAMEQHMLGL